MPAGLEFAIPAEHPFIHGAREPPTLTKRSFCPGGMAPAFVRSGRSDRVPQMGSLNSRHLLPSVLKVGHPRSRWWQAGFW